MAKLYHSLSGIIFMLSSACASWHEGSQGLVRREPAFFREGTEVVVCTRPEKPAVLQGDDPTISSLNLNQNQWYQQAIKHYAECKKRALKEKYEISGPDPVPLDDGNILEKQVKFLEQREDKSALEKYAVRLEGANENLRKALFLPGNIEFNPKVTVNPTIDVMSEVDPGAADSREGGGGGFGKVGLPPAGSWVGREVGNCYLPSNVLKSIGNSGQAPGYKVEYLGKVTFTDCEVNPHPSSSGIWDLVEKLQGYGSLAGKTLVLLGNADQRDAEKCFSKNNSVLSGHRAVSVLNKLYDELGGSLLDKAHADVIPFGTERNERSVEAYLIGK